MNLGEAVRIERRKRKWSQDRLAVEADVITKTISNIERGAFNTRIRTLYSVCDALEMTPAQLFAEAEKYE